ncbi:MAG: lipid A deacylase LpxR family protein [Bacteroidia bacterium]|nr:lipid A deacylase LpxR family protein [Bacteroidia bacterium]
MTVYTADAQDFYRSNRIKFTYDNDFFSETDRYYTQGLRLDYTAQAIGKSPVSKLLFTIQPSTLKIYTLTFQQDGYTPRSISYKGLYAGERPYSGMFYLTHSLLSISTEKKQRFTTSLALGLIGPESMGEQEQKQIHHWLHNISPNGWQYQIHTDAIVNYNFMLEQGLITGKYADLLLSGEARVGTLFTDVAIGTQIRAGLLTDYFNVIGLKRGKNNFQCYFTGKANIKAVGYNATLQGGVFNHSSPNVIPSSDVDRFVGQAKASVTVSYKRVVLEYQKVYLSREFKGGLPHGWGCASIAVWL